MRSWMFIQENVNILERIRNPTITIYYVNTQCKARSNRKTSPPAVPSPPILVSESARPRGREDERSVKLPSRAFELDRERAASIALGNFFACTAQPANVSPDVCTAFDNLRLSSNRSKKRRVLGTPISRNFSDISIAHAIKDDIQTRICERGEMSLHETHPEFLRGGAGERERERWRGAKGGLPKEGAREARRRERKGRKKKRKEKRKSHFAAIFRS